MYTTGIVTDNRYIKHDPGAFHPESPRRLEALYEMLESGNMRGKFYQIEPRLVEMSELTLIHRQSYIDEVAATAGIAHTSLDADTVTSADSYEAALLAAGGLIEAVDLVMEGTLKNAFAFVRPPGHHAEAGRSGGFCLFNNVAVAAAAARKKHGLKRILITDWDLHHGNGTQHSFYDDPGVLYFSTHQYPYYPGTGSAGEIGRGPGEGYTINVPLSRGRNDTDYVRIFKELLEPVALAYKPELMLLSAGFDICRGDTLGGMEVSVQGFAKLMRVLMNTADQCCDGRLVATLEGGYNISMLVQSSKAVLKEMNGETRVTDRDIEETAQGAAVVTDQVLNTVKERIAPFWPAGTFR
jgi:acetoin utilization deacetylase AcuC-like enzyme